MTNERGMQRFDAWKLIDAKEVRDLGSRSGLASGNSVQYSLVTVCHRRFMERLEIVNLTQPTEVREFSHGRLEIFEIAGQVIGRASYKPGWRWSEHVGPLVGTDLCPTEHLGLVISGRCAVKMADGAETTMKPGDLFAIPPGHDSWVVGDEPYVSLHLSGADTYGAAST